MCRKPKLGGFSGTPGPRPETSRRAARAQLPLNERTQPGSTALHRTTSCNQPEPGTAWEIKKSELNTSRNSTSSLSSLAVLHAKRQRLLKSLGIDQNLVTGRDASASAFSVPRGSG